MTNDLANVSNNNCTELANTYVEFDNRKFFYDKPFTVEMHQKVIVGYSFLDKEVLSISEDLLRTSWDYFANPLPPYFNPYRTFKKYKCKVIEGEMSVSCGRDEPFPVIVFEKGTILEFEFSKEDMPDFIKWIKYIKSKIINDKDTEIQRYSNIKKSEQA